MYDKLENCYIFPLESQQVSLCFSLLNEVKQTYKMNWDTQYAKKHDRLSRKKQTNQLFIFLLLLVVNSNKCFVLYKHLVLTKQNTIYKFFLTNSVNINREKYEFILKKNKQNKLESNFFVFENHIFWNGRHELNSILIFEFKQHDLSRKRQLQSEIFFIYIFKT